MKKLAGLGCLALLLCLPLQAGHRHEREYRRGGQYLAPGFVEVYVATPYGQGAFVRGFRPTPYGYRDSRFDSYGRGDREFRRFKYKHRQYFKRHKHYHYDGYCPY